jgi:hypothetical protein
MSVSVKHVRVEPYHGISWYLMVGISWLVSHGWHMVATWLVSCRHVAFVVRGAAVVKFPTFQLYVVPDASLDCHLCFVPKTERSWLENYSLVCVILQLLKMLCRALMSLVNWKGVGSVRTADRLPPPEQKIRGSVNYFVLFYLSYYSIGMTHIGKTCATQQQQRQQQQRQRQRQLDHHAVTISWIQC